LFPAAIEALGDLGDGLTTEVWWSPSHPFTSSLTKQSAKQLAESYESTTRTQWTQPIGFAHALFEVAVDSLKRTKELGNHASLRDAIKATNLKTVVGDVKWGGPGPFKNVSKTPLVLGQWVKGKKYKYELVIVSNTGAPAIPVGGKMKAM
jgi:branched-chain amino acid transport system substrate-binding protein